MSLAAKFLRRGSGSRGSGGHGEVKVAVKVDGFGARRYQEKDIHINDGSPQSQINALYSSQARIYGEEILLFLYHFTKTFAPLAAGPASPLIVPTPTSKAGFCPRPLGPLGELGSLLGLRSGAAGGAGDTRSLAAGETEASAAEGRAAEGSDRRDERRQTRKERRERQKRSPQSRDRDDRRERRLNRQERTRGRVTRQAEEPDQRFFLPKLPNIFCRDECFNDFDCLGSLKCCIKDDCRSCTNPTFF
ncbi:uncharacterized protein LOC125037931 [Penaeus chinensis]|uniref:uncharacterized protein LOC125037931 n=1 Tax=Penaeus chinensis TaxID=139456 RepID=UPI001FB77770|nr:uncharacterized protein LOC125037931 [Penaeus chinensis]